MGFVLELTTYVVNPHGNVDVLPHPILELSGEFEHAEGDVVEFVEDGFFEITSITKLDDGRQLVKARRPPFGVA